MMELYGNSSQRPLPELGSHIPQYSNRCFIFLDKTIFWNFGFSKNNRKFVEPAIQLVYGWIFNLPLKGRVITWGACLFGCSLSFMLHINTRINNRTSHDLSQNNNLVSISVHNLTLKDQRQKQKDWRLLADFTNMRIPFIIHAESCQDIIIIILPPKQLKTHTHTHTHTLSLSTHLKCCQTWVVKKGRETEKTTKLKFQFFFFLGSFVL
jgi:hypothetical protein